MSHTKANAGCFILYAELVSNSMRRNLNLGSMCNRILFAI
jgi:hypothetical protein